MNFFRSPRFLIGINILLGIAIAVSLYDLFQQVLFELQGTLHTDGAIFMAVGRGILNGLTPYIDLFENKPPGIFLMHAASLKLFDSQLLVKILEVLVFLFIPLCLIVPAIKMVQPLSRMHRNTILLVTVLFGILLSLYASNQSGEGQPESYGAFFGLVYIAVVASFDKINRWCVLLLGILMALAVGMKEPFVLTILAGVLVLRPQWPEWKRAFLIPFCITTVLGFFLLFLLGYLGPYFLIYLRHIFSFHIGQPDMPVWFRTFDILRVFVNAGAYSYFFAGVYTILWLSPLILFWRRAASPSEFMYSFGRWFLITYLTMLAIALGGDFYGHHFVFALPVYGAFYLFLLRVFTQQMPQGILRTLGAFFVALLILTVVFSHRLTYYKERARAWNEWESQMKQIAFVVDTVMERCDIPRYLQLHDKGKGPYAYTQKSPYGPIFIHYSRFLLGNDLYTEKLSRVLLMTDIVLFVDMSDASMTPVGNMYIKEHFTEKPWECAKPFKQPLPYKILFRKDGS